jgi:hypothetical protein
MPRANRAPSCRSKWFETIVAMIVGLQGRAAAINGKHASNAIERPTIGAQTHRCTPSTI